MSAFYDLASLVVVPSGYKASKVYAQKPLTTDGQLTFSRASTATRVNSAGLIETVSSNVPRLDYLNSSCPRLLLEPQRTNLALYSEQFDNASWIKYKSTVTANATTAPDGTISADLIVDDANNDAHAVYQAITAGAGVYTWSVFAKAQNLNFLIISAYTGSHNRTWFNLSNGTVGTNAAGNTATITSVGNGWYKCSVSRSYTSGTFVTEISPSNANGVSSYVGSGNGIFVWGAQVEAGAYATSYIPTLGAAVTRGADACSKTGISSLIGQTEGTIFAEFQYYDNIAVGSAQYISPLTISNGGYTEAVYFEIFNDSLSAIVFKNAALQAAITKSNLTSGTHRAALAYKQNDIAFYLDGVLVGTDSSADISSAMSQINLGTVGSSTNLDQAYTQTQALLFKTRLTNAQLAELTAL